MVGGHHTEGTVFKGLVRNILMAGVAVGKGSELSVATFLCLCPQMELSQEPCAVELQTL